MERIKKITALSKEIETLERRQGNVQKDFDSLTSQTSVKRFRFINIEDDEDFSVSLYSIEDILHCIEKSLKENQIKLNEKVKELQDMLK